MTAQASFRAWSIFCVMAAANLLSSLQQVGLATVSGDVALSFQADAAALGLLSAVFSYTYAAMQIPAGILVDTAGSRRSVTAALILAAAGTFLFASASSLPPAYLGRMLTGIGLSLVAVPLMKLTSVWFPAKDFGKMTAISFVIGSIGYWAATTPAAWLSAVFGWRIPFLGIAAGLAVLALLVFVIVRDSPEGETKTAKSKEGGSILSMLRRIASSRQLWLLGFWYLLQGGVYFSFVGLWAGQYLTQVLHMEGTTSGWVLAPAAGALITAPVFTWLASATGKRRILFLTLPAVSFVLAIPLVFGVENWPEGFLCLFFFLLSTSSIGGAAVVFDAAKVMFPVSLSGTVCGFINMFPLIGGALMQQFIGGLISFFLGRGMEADKAFTSTFLVYVVCALLACILGWNYLEHKENRQGSS